MQNKKTEKKVRQKTNSPELAQKELIQKAHRTDVLFCCALDFTDPGGESDDPDIIDQQAEETEESGLPAKGDINE